MSILVIGRARNGYACTDDAYAQTRCAYAGQIKLREDQPRGGRSGESGM
jgi:hypothetical protein